MKRPDSTFTVTVNPVFTVAGCEEKQALEARGCFGFHNYRDCPNCRVMPRGYEFWGENGHKQGGATDRAGLLHWISRKAREQWRMKAGRLMGYRFRKGQAIYYQG